VAAAQDGDGSEAGVRLASTNNHFIIRKEGPGVTHGTSVALTKERRKPNKPSDALLRALRQKTLPPAGNQCDNRL
jgi:hypothetical protein